MARCHAARLPPNSSRVAYDTSRVGDPNGPLGVDSDGANRQGGRAWNTTNEGLDGPPHRP
jgi:hypothetical protein